MKQDQSRDSRHLAQSSDALARATNAGGEVVGFRDLQRRIRHSRGLRADAWLFANSKVGLRLRAIIEPENTFDDGIELGRNGERAGAATVCARAMLIPAQVGA